MPKGHVDTTKIGTRGIFRDGLIHPAITGPVWTVSEIFRRYLPDRGVATKQALRVPGKTHVGSIIAYNDRTSVPFDFLSQISRSHGMRPVQGNGRGFSVPASK